MTPGASHATLGPPARAAGGAGGPGYLSPSRNSRRAASVLIVAGAAATVLGLLRQPERTWANLLLNDFYLLSAGLGAALFLAINHLSGSAWCAGLRRVPEAMLSVLPPAGLLVLALFFGRHALYSWSQPGGLGAEGVLADKAAYLSTPFVFARMLIVLSLWLLLARRLRRTSLRQDLSPGRERQQRLVRDSAVFVVVFAYSFSLASFDWLMSLDPRWSSTIFAVYLFAGVFVSCLALITLCTVLLVERGYLAEFVNENHLHDLGGLLFAFSTFWAYVWLSQYLLIWYGNIPDEITHYSKRTGDPWIGLFLLNLILNWLVPFVVLMSRAAKRNPVVLKWVCVVLLAGRWLDLYLTIVPELAGGPTIGPLELLIFAGYAGLFLSFVLPSLAGAPLVPLGDPYLEECRRHQR